MAVEPPTWPAARPELLTLATSWGPEEPAELTDVLTRYVPPFELAADMLFTAALAPAEPLRRAFPRAPFLSLFGRTPLVTWFSRITSACSGDPDGRPRLEEGVLYHELNVLAPLRRRAVFVPDIQATSARTIAIAHRYGMPKRPNAMSFRADRSSVLSVAVDGARRSHVRASLLGTGALPAALLSRFRPWQAWPVYFPSGRHVRATILDMPRVQLARILTGQLAIEASWLPRSLPLLPFGLYAAGLRMRLPPPWPGAAS